VHTFMDVRENVVDLSAVLDVEAWPAGYLPKARLRVPSAKTIQLPHHSDGLPTLATSVPLGDLSVDDWERARHVLLSRPSFLAPLPTPSERDLAALHYLLGPHEKVQTVLIAVAIRVRPGTHLYGHARLIVALNGVRIGSHLIIECADSWSFDADSLLTKLAVTMGDCPTDLVVGPEPGATPWRTVVALLGGRMPKQPPSWTRHLQIAAGLLRVKLTIELDADSRSKSIRRNLRVNPPEGLLIWSDQLRHANDFESDYRVARPNGLVDRFSPSDPADSSSVVGDLVVHLRLFTDEINSPTDEDFDLDWESVVPSIMALIGPHFVLSDRARSQLRGNPYPRPARMLQYLTRLEVVAREYREKSGELGSRLADHAMSTTGIEIALTDKALACPVVYLEGIATDLVATPHVKVDDVKTTDQCGRIYFATDLASRRFVVDHIGLHDYGK
jgi:hypothetical protein